MIKARNPEKVAVMNSYFYQHFDRGGLEYGMVETRTYIKEDLREKDITLIPISGFLLTQRWLTFFPRSNSIILIIVI